MKVFLLTSHPVAPPWNSGDKNLARTLLTTPSDAEFAFIGDRADPSPWPAEHRRLFVRASGFMPSATEKVRLFARLATATPASDLTHLIVTFQPSRVTPRVLGSLPALRRPFVATVPGGDFQPLDLFRRAGAVVALTRRTADRLVAAGLPRVEVLAPGVDLDRFTAEPVENGWADLGAGPGPFLLFAGHHDPFGGLEQALDLCAAVRRRVPGLRLVAAMRHRPSEDPDALRRRLEAMAAERGMAGAVVHLGGMANMAAAILAAQAVVFQPSRMGMKMELPLTLLEALACGRPVVVSPVQTLPEIGSAPAVWSGGARDPELVDHVARLLEDPAWFAECSAAARQLAERRFSAAAMVDGYLQLYREIAG